MITTAACLATKHAAKYPLTSSWPHSWSGAHWIGVTLLVAAVTGSIGYADSLDEAKEALKQKWFEETKKLSKH